LSNDGVTEKQKFCNLLQSSSLAVSFHFRPVLQQILGSNPAFEVCLNVIFGLMHACHTDSCARIPVALLEGFDHKNINNRPLSKVFFDHEGGGLWAGLS